MSMSAASAAAPGLELGSELASFGFGIPKDGSTAMTILTKLQERHARMPAHARLGRVISLLREHASALACTEAVTGRLQ